MVANTYPRLPAVRRHFWWVPKTQGLESNIVRKSEFNSGLGELSSDECEIEPRPAEPHILNREVGGSTPSSQNLPNLERSLFLIQTGGGWDLPLLTAPRGLNITQRNHLTSFYLGRISLVTRSPVVRGRNTGNALILTRLKDALEIGGLRSRHFLPNMPGKYGVPPVV
jgi:hypothetical protein